MAAAYYYRDEPDFNLLASFFGLHDVKVEATAEVITISDNSHEVIVISDTDPPDVPTRVQPFSSPVDSDEVTSPMPVASAFVRRKLFDAEDPCIPDLYGSSSTPRCKETKSVKFSSPKGSSSASWSPLSLSR